MPKYHVSINNPGKENGFLDSVKAYRYQVKPSTRDLSIRKEKEVMRWESIMENLRIYVNFKTLDVPLNDGTIINGLADSELSKFEFTIETQNDYDFSIMYENTLFTGKNAVMLIVARSLSQQSTKVREIFNPTLVDGLNNVPYGSEIIQVISESLDETMTETIPLITVTEI